MKPIRTEIIALVAEGLSDKRIARQLGLTVPAICKHVLMIRKELGAANRVGAAVAWTRIHG